MEPASSRDHGDGAPLSSEDEPELVVLLGKPDAPTDGLQDHGERLAAAVRRRGVSATIARLRWDLRGWPHSLRTLWRLRGRGRLVLFQVTPAAWSNRNVPFFLLAAVAEVRIRGGRAAVLIHDPFPQTPQTLRGRLWRARLAWIYRRLVEIADAAFVPIEPEIVPWARARHRRRMDLLPSGSNIDPVARRADSEPGTFTIAVFCISLSNPDELPSIITIVNRVVERNTEPIRLRVFGRGARDAEPLLRAELDERVELEISGFVEEDRASALLSGADVLLFVRGGVSSRRGTYAAALAHGLPVVAYASEETGWPATEGGVVVVRYGDEDAAANAIRRLIADPEKRRELRERSHEAYARFFDWDRSARMIAQHLRRAEADARAADARSAPDTLRE